MSDRSSTLGGLGGLSAAAVILLGLACGEDGPTQDAAPPPSATEFRSETVDSSLDGAAELVRTRGFTLEGDPWRGFLVDQSSAVREVSMQGQTCYVVLAAGSAALREVDLRIFGGDGTEVAQDAHMGRRAGIHYCPPHAGTYYVAARATAGTGLFGVLFFRGPPGLEIRLDDAFRDRPAAAPERP